MMRKFFWLCFLFASVLSFADEPSVQAECESGYKEYHYDETKLQLCPNNDGSYKVDATAVGSNYHTCWWLLTLSKAKGDFSASRGDCTLNVIFGEESLNAQFIGQCRDSCGMRASFKSGKFIEHLPANSKSTKSSPEENNKQTIQLWTGNKLLVGDIAACTNVTKSVYPAETYFYANLNENRTGIHCTSIKGQTFVYGSVAGVDIKMVESLRNDIFGQL
jgi:hypothetical protein